MEGAYYNGQYLNRLERLGYSQAEIDNKLESTFEEMFYGPEGVRLCHCAGPDMMYIEDTGNHDVRTEGMSYAMMFCVQMNRQKEFDCLWRWVVTHMYLTEGENAGYFAWSCHTDGSKNSDGPAPDGEEFLLCPCFCGQPLGFRRRSTGLRFLGTAHLARMCTQRRRSRFRISHVEPRKPSHQIHSQL